MADFNFVLPRLATGAAVSTEADVQQLVDAGITHVLDCRDEFDDAPLLASHPMLHYCWDGTPDDGQPKSVSWFIRGLAFALPTYAQPKRKVYCHCAAGVNRGPSMAYAIMLALGFPSDLAEQLIRKARAQVGLAYKGDADKILPLLGY